MIRNSPLPAIYFLIVFFMAACNYPAAATLSIDDQAGTIVAGTLTAQLPIDTPQMLTTPTPKTTGTPTLTKTPTSTITPTYSIPLLTVKESTNCRMGPGQNYDIVTVVQPGGSAEIVGRYPINNWWLIKNPLREGTCWIWGEYATASGSHWTVPSVTPPATATQGLPDPPGISNWDYFCGYGANGLNVTVNLNWRDRTDVEQGYRILRDEQQIADLAPNSTSYSETIDVTTGQTVSYRIEVFNSTGSTSSTTISLSCQ